MTIEQLFPLHKGITVQSECPIDLIGDDIQAVAKKKAKEIGTITIAPSRRCVTRLCSTTI
jgi:nitrogenase molybdenum-iron protein alpha chain